MAEQEKELTAQELIELFDRMDDDLFDELAGYANQPESTDGTEQQEPDKKRLVQLTVRFNANAYDAIRQVASENHLSAAELVRMAIDGKLASYLGTVRFMDYEQGEEIREAIRKLYTEISKVQFELNKIGVNYNQTVKRQNALLKTWDQAWEEKAGQMNAGQKMNMQLQKESIIRNMELDRAALDRAVQEYTKVTKEVAKVLCRILT